MPSVEQVQCHSVFILPWKEVTRDEHQEQHLSSTAPGASQVFSTSFCLSLSPKSEGNTENGTRLATIQMEKSATFTLETAVHWLTAPTGDQICRKSPWDGRKRSTILVQLGETGTPLEMAPLVSCSLSQCSGSLPSVLAPTAGILLLLSWKSINVLYPLLSNSGRC